MPCANWHTQNLVIPTQPLVAPHHHHVVNGNLILCTMLMTVVVLSVVVLAATLAVAPHLVHPIVLVMMMIAAAADPHVHAMTTISGTMISLPILQCHFLFATLESILVLTAPLSYMAISWPNVTVTLMLQNLLVHPTTTTTILWLLEMPIILPGAQTQIKIPTTLLISTSTVTVKTLPLLPTKQLMLIILTMMMTANLIVVAHPPSQASPARLPLTSEILPIPKQNNTVIGIIPNWMHNPQLG